MPTLLANIKLKYNKVLHRKQGLQSPKRRLQAVRVAGHSPKTPCWDFIPNPENSKPPGLAVGRFSRRRVPRTLFPAALFHSLKTKIGNTVARLSPERSDAKHPVCSGIRDVPRTYMETMYRSAPLGFPHLFLRSKCRSTACVETFIISWYNHPKRYKEAAATWQVSKARRGS